MDTWAARLGEIASDMMRTDCGQDEDDDDEEPPDPVGARP
jgi:hypothetical protein